MPFYKIFVQCVYVTLLFFSPKMRLTSGATKEAFLKKIQTFSVHSGSALH